MSVNVVINGVRRQGVGVESAVLVFDVSVGTSHQLLPFHEQQLLSLGSLTAQINFVVQQAVAATTAAAKLTSLPTSAPDYRSTTAATGSAPVAGFGITQRTVTDDTTVTTSDYLILCDCTTKNIVVTLPTAIGNAGQRFEVQKTDSSAHTATLTPAGAEKINGASTLVLSLQNQAATITSNNANYFATPNVVAQVNMTAAQLAAVSDAAAKSALTALSAGLVAEGIFAAPA